MTYPIFLVDDLGYTEGLWLPCDVLLYNLLPRFSRLSLQPRLTTEKLKLNRASLGHLARCSPETLNTPITSYMYANHGESDVAGSLNSLHYILLLASFISLILHLSQPKWSNHGVLLWLVWKSCKRTWSDHITTIVTGHGETLSNSKT